MRSGLPSRASALAFTLLLAAIGRGAAEDAERAFAESAASVLDEAAQAAAALRSTYRLSWTAAGPGCVNDEGREGFNVRTPEQIDQTRDGECSNLPGLSLIGKDLAKARLSGALLADARFERSVLAGATMRRTQMPRAHLRNADLAGAVLDEANLLKADLTAANLGGASLKNAAMSGVVLRHANLKGTDFGDELSTETDLSKADMRWVQVDRTTVIKRAYMPGVDLSGGTDLRGADFSRTHLKKANLSDADLRDANFANAYLPGATLANADLRGTNLSEATLTGADLKGAKFNAKTKLPISAHEAQQRGMVMVSDDAPGQAAQLSFDLPDKAGVSKQGFHRIIDALQAEFRADFARLKVEPSFSKLWDDDQEQTEVIYAEGPSGVEPIVRFCGGLARHRRMTEDAFALVTCHEMGHPFGGEPFLRTEHGLGYSTCGQADYFAASVCMKRLYGGADNAAALSGKRIHPQAAELCRQADDPTLCIRIVMAALSATAFLAEKRQVQLPDLSTPSAAVAQENDRKGSPSPQCRLDTYVAGALGLPRPACWYAGPDR